MNATTTEGLTTDAAVDDDRGLLRRVAGSGVWAMVAYGATAGSSFFISVLLARALGPGQWGRYSYYLWICRLVPALIALGIPDALAKTIAEKIGRGDDDQARALFGLSIRVHVLLVPVLLAAGGALLWAHRPGASLTLVVLFGIAIGLLLLDGEAILAGLRRFRALGVFAVALSVIQAVAVVIGVVVGLSWQLFVYLMVATGTGGLVAMLVVCWSSIRRMRPPSLPRGEAGAFLRFAALCGFMVFLDSILWGRAELVFLDRYRTSADIGFYTAALRLASVAAVLPFVAGKPLLPEFSRLRGAEHHDRLRALYPQACELLVVLAAPLAAIGAVLAPAAVQAVYGRAYAPAATVTAILMGSSLLYALTAPITAAVLTGNRPRFVAEIGAVSIVANLALDVVLIPPFGVEGAALANIAVQLCWIVLGIGYVSRRLGLAYPTGTLLRAVSLAAVAAAAAGAVTRVSHGLAALVAGGAVGVAVYALAIAVTGTLDLGRVRHSLAIARETPGA